MTPYRSTVVKLARAASTGIRPLFKGSGSERPLSTGEKLGAAAAAAAATPATTQSDNWYPNLSIPRPLDTNVIQPKFWNKVHHQDPASYMIDCTNYDLNEHPDKIPELAAQIKEKFRKTGCVLLTNGNTTCLDAMERWARVPMRKVMKYEGGANSRDHLHNNVYETGAPGTAYLHYHHEMAYVKESVEALAFLCTESINDKADPLRGASFLSDQIMATEKLLKTTVGQKLKEKGICYIRCLTDKEGTDSQSWKAIEAGKTTGTPIYNHWQDSFNVTSTEAAQKAATQKGLYWEWAPQRFLKTKFYVSGFEYCPFNDKNILYSSIADDGAWFDTWPGMETLPNMGTYEEASELRKPLLITYGDNTHFTQEELAEYTHIYDECGFPIGGEKGWTKGDIAIVCNYRFAHGRPGYHLNKGERRELGVILGPMYTRQGCKEDKW